jgi:gluconate 2-dehydrogenase gamma chain
MEKIKRREAIKKTSLIMGAALSSSLVAGVMAGCEVEPALDWEPKALSPEQASLVSDLVERILPATDTPGAKEAGVARFIDSMVEGYLTETDRDTFNAGLLWLRERNFRDQSESDQDQLVKELAEEARKQSSETENKPFFLLAKEMTLLGFFTSEVGATQVLSYDPVPGAYQGCKPLEELGGKAWAM